jgi:hypothetical protein
MGVEMPPWRPAALEGKRGVKHFKYGNMDIAYRPRCGRQRNITTARKKQKVVAA